VQAELILVRHGETEGQSSVRLYGSTDVALSDLGRRQMQSVRSALGGLDFDRVLVSPLQRSRESAAIVCRASTPPSIVVASFAEIDFGAWEGLTAEEVSERDPQGYRQWKGGDEDWAFPDGDSRGGFADRVSTAALDVFGDGRERFLAVLHKGVVKTIVGTLLGQTHAIYSRMPCELGSICRLVRRDGVWKLIGECEVDHLGSDRLQASR